MYIVDLLARELRREKFNRLSVGGGFYASLPLIDSSNATAVICSTPRNPFSPEGEFSSHQISLAHG